MNPRRFEPGFRTDFEGLQMFCDSHGYQFGMYRGRYILRPHGERGLPKLFTKAEVLREVDRQIRIPRGYEPILAEG